MQQRPELTPSCGLPSPLPLSGNRSGGVRVKRPDLTSALAVDSRLTEIERQLHLLPNVTPINNAVIDALERRTRNCACTPRANS